MKKRASAKKSLPVRRVYRPRDLREIYGRSAPTIWRMETQGKLPPRDAFVNGVAIGWKPETIDAALAGPAVA